MSASATELPLAAVLLQLIVMIGAARLFHNLARRLNQPGVTGEIVSGLLLGPSFFGQFFPHSAGALFSHDTVTPITIISQIGLILLMFQIGADFSFGQLGNRRNLASSGRHAPQTTFVTFTRDV